MPKTVFSGIQIKWLFVLGCSVLLNTAKKEFVLKGGYCSHFFLLKNLQMEKFKIVVGNRVGHAFKEGEEKFYHLSRDIALKHGLEVYDLDYLKGNPIARAYIYNPKYGYSYVWMNVSACKSFPSSYVGK